MGPLNWIGEAFNAVSNALGSGFDSVGDWFSSISSNIGGWFSELGINISNWFSNVVDDISQLSSSVGRWFSDLGDNIGGWFGNLIDKMGGWFTSLIDFSIEMLSYLNPFSDKFFLWIAFVPDDDFFKNYSNNFSNLLETKFAFFYQLKDSFIVSVDAIKSGVFGWDGLDIDLTKYGAGKLNIINPDAIGYYSEKVKFWIGGLMIFFTAAWLIRKTSTVLGAGK